MVNTNMFEFKHPKYYKELRKRNRAGSIDRAMLPDSQSDQVISKQQATASSTRSPGSSLKQQAASVKLQAASYKLPDSFTLIKFYRDRSQGLY